MSKIVQKIINANAQKSGSAVVGIAGARALNASEFLDDKHTIDTQSIDQATSVIEASLKNRYDYTSYYTGGFNVARHLFNKNEQGVWFNPSDMTATKAGWRRNLLTYSESLTTSPWSVNEASLESATPPSGISLAWKLKETGNSGVHFAGRVLNTVLSAGVQYTLSVYAKAGERSILSIVGESTATTLCDFNLSAGTAHPAASATGTITSVGDGWYRCSMTWTAAASPSTTYFATKQSLAGGLVFTGTLNSGLFLAAAQLELGSTPSEYQRITDFSTEFKAAFPTHTLYQDANGVTPCTAAGQPVGLILDQSRGGLGALGPELVTNGGFTSDSNWVKGTSAVIANGYLEQPTGTGSFSYQVFPTQAGKWYRVTFDVLQGTFYAGVWSVAPTGTILGGGNSYTPSSRVIWFIANDNDAAFSFVCNDGIGRIDNISVREVPGNHAYQSSSGARPTLARIPSSGRRNVLTYSEQLDNAAWTKRGTATITQNDTTAPDGTLTADKLSGLNGGSNDVFNTDYNTFVMAAAGTSYVPSFWIKRISTSGVFFVSNPDTSAKGQWNIDLSQLPDEWVRITATTPGVTVVNAFVTAAGGQGGILLRGVSGGPLSMHVWGFQSELGSSATNYQKVVATTDVTESGFNDLWHLVFDGSDDSLVTNAVDFSGTDEMTVIAGVRRNGTSTGMIIELTADVNNNNGGFFIYNESLERFFFVSKGSISRSILSSSITTPSLSVLTLQADISQPILTARRNGTQLSTTSNTQGTGSYTNAAIYIGRRGGTTEPLNGHLYQLIVRGKTTSIDQIEQVEDFVKRKSGLSY